MPAGVRAGRRARGRSRSRHRTASQYGYVPLGRHHVNCESPDEEIVSDEFHLLCVEDAVESARSYPVRRIGQSNTNHHILETQHAIGQRQ